MAEQIAPRRSAQARSSLAEPAISIPSDETAIAAMTPPVSVAKRLTNQLKFRASTLRPDVWLRIWLAFVKEFLAVLGVRIGALCGGSEEAVGVPVECGPGRGGISGRLSAVGRRWRSRRPGA